MRICFGRLGGVGAVSLAFFYFRAYTAREMES
jgi:hypothetical protein